MNSLLKMKTAVFLFACVIGGAGLTGCSKSDTADQPDVKVGTKPPGNVHLQTDGKAGGAGAPQKQSTTEGG